MKVNRPDPKFRPITLVLESQAEVSLLLGLLQLNRDSSGQIMPSELSVRTHRDHMQDGKDASDTMMYNELRAAANGP